MVHDVDIGTFRVGGSHPHFLIAGPCVIESEHLVVETAHRIAEIARALSMPYIFKSSYDKANRSSIDSFRGPGVQEGMAILQKVKRDVGVPILTDVHSVEDAIRAAEVAAFCKSPRSSAGRPICWWRRQRRGVWSMSKKASFFPLGK